MRTIEPTVQEMIEQRGENGKLKLSFDELDLFGSPENARVIFMKLKEEGEQYELLQDIINIVITKSLEFDLLEKYEL